MKKSKLLFWILLVSYGCSPIASTLAVSEHINGIFFVGYGTAYRDVQFEKPFKGLWLLKESYLDPFDTTKYDCDWSLILKNPNFIGHNSNFVLVGRTTKPKKFIIIQMEGNLIKSFKTCRDSMKFVAMRKEMLVPDSIDLIPVIYKKDAPIISDTIKTK